MTHLVLFACPGMPAPAVVRAYEQALGDDVALRWIAKPGFSGVFKQIAHQHRGAGDRVLPGLLRTYAADVPDPWTVSFIGFSAGVWLARDGLYGSDADMRALTASVLLDGAHTPHDAQGRPRDTELSRFVVASRTHPLVLVYSDTQTPPPGHPDGYASTTAVAEAMMAIPAPATYIHCPGGHGPVLTQHGPDIVATRLRPILDAATPPAPPEPWSEPGLSWGEAAVEWSLEQVRLGGVERPPGSNGGPYVAGLFAPATRLLNGAERRLGLTRGAWCAAAACAAAAATAPADAVWPHGYRVSGVELLADGRRLGTFRGPDWTPRRGDVAILTRPGESWYSHTVRVLEADGDQLRTLGGNEGECWRVSERQRRDVLGFIEYPRLVSAGHIEAGPSYRGTPRRLDPLRDVMAGDGMDEVQRLLDAGVELVG